MRTLELRIGNYYIYKEDSEIQKIDDAYSLYLIAENIKDIEPIELTEDILLKCGFEKEKNNILEKDGIRLFKIRDLYFRGNFPIRADIKYLHQLQNLYFALTNKELNIEL